LSGEYPRPLDHEKRSHERGLYEIVESLQVQFGAGQAFEKVWRIAFLHKVGHQFFELVLVAPHVDCRDPHPRQPQRGPFVVGPVEFDFDRLEFQRIPLLLRHRPVVRLALPLATARGHGESVSVVKANQPAPRGEDFLLTAGYGQDGPAG